MIYPQIHLALGRLSDRGRFQAETVSTYHVGRDHDGNITILATVLIGDRADVIHTFDPSTPLADVLEELSGSGNPLLRALAPMETPRIDRFMTQAGDLQKVDPESGESSP